MFDMSLNKVYSDEKTNIMKTYRLFGGILVGIFMALSLFNFYLFYKDKPHSLWEMQYHEALWLFFGALAFSLWLNIFFFKYGRKFFPSLIFSILMVGSTGILFGFSVLEMEITKWDLTSTIWAFVFSTLLEILFTVWGVASRTKAPARGLFPF
jgi:hypothetical protein